MTLVAVACLTLAPKAVLAQEAVKVRAGIQGQQGRMVFDWASAVRADAKIEGRDLTVTFDRPGNFDLSAVTATLAGFLTDAQVGGDGKSIRMSLTGDFRLSRFQNGTAVVIDLIGTPSRVAPPAPPTPTKAETAALPPPPPEQAPTSLKPRVRQVAPAGDMVLQIGQQQAFTRLAFIWPSTAPSYKLDKAGNAITITFDRSTQVDLGRAVTDPPKLLREVRVFNRSGKTDVVLNVDPGTTTRDFADDRTVIVDLVAARARNSSAPVEPAQKQIEADEKARSEIAGQTLPSNVKVFDPNSGPLPERLTTPALAQAQREDAERRALAEAAKTQAALGGSASQPGQSAAQPALPVAAPKRPSEEPRAPVQRSPGGAQPMPQTPAGSVGNVVVTVEPDPLGQKLVFPFPVKTPAAFFTRAGQIFAVFDAQASLDLKAVGALKGRQMPTQRGTIAIFDLPEGRMIEAGLDVHTWSLKIVTDAAKGEPVEVTPRPNKPGGSDLLIQLRERGEVQRLTDPVVGDRLDIATTARPNHGVGARRDFLGFALWPTQQGAVVVPDLEAIQTVLDPEGVAVMQDGGLMLSNGVKPTEQAMKGAAGTPGAEGFVDFDKWGRQAEGPFRRVRARLERTAALAPKSLKNTARLELARFFLANHFHAEALGELNLMSATDDELNNDPAFRAMRGVAKLGLYRPKEALADLSVPALQLDANSALWRGLANAQLQDWPAAAAEFRRGFPVLERYPNRERLELKKASVRTAIELNDRDTASKDLSEILQRKPQGVDLIQAQYLGGRLRELTGDLPGATVEYDRVIAGSDRQSRANARYRKILIQEKLGRITSATAIEELETLRFTWRGDDLERDILRSLGLFYIKSGDFRAGFETMRQAMTMFAETRQAQEIRDDMNRVFNDLFLRGGANALSPVKALGLYYDFRELTPIGNEGDEMIRRLADRMVSVDLLPQAAELLRHQVEKRLAGTAQAQVAARLAVIYLLDKKPAEALQVIEKTQQIQLPPALALERQRFRARAQMELGRTIEATQSIQGDNSIDAQYLRADILWHGQQWMEAGARLEELLNNVRGADAKIDPVAQSLILRATIAYALAGDRTALARMTQTFGARMDKTPDGPSFSALTAAPDITNVEFRQLATRIATTQTYETFLSSYRDRIRNGGLNAIN